MIHRSKVFVFVMLLVLTLGSLSTASAAVPVDSSELRGAVTVEGIMEHLTAFQAIATANNDNRAAGSSGYDSSAEYVAALLDAAGYDVTRQYFEFAFFQQLSPTVLDQVAPNSVSYTEGVDYIIMEYSGSGNVQAPVQAVDVLIPSPAANASTSGCEASDFAGFPAGSIALIQRGACTFYQKAANAQAAGAVGVIIFNEGDSAGRSGLLNGTLGGPGINIPVVGATFALGQELYNLVDDGLVVHLVTDTASEIRETYNVIAETPQGRDDRVVVVGAHLDSVPEGPGINDNGSGSAVILEIALQMAALGIEPVNTVRFAFWSAEESGLLGSEYYVSQLSKRDIKDIAVNLNFDMVASPNYVRFVYDGDGSATGVSGPTGSGVVEDVFMDYFASQGLAAEPTEFSGRSDYGPFIAVGIPAGGLFTGAEGVKTVEQAAVYGGTAGIAYDPCYHQACDDIDNLNLNALDEMSDAAADAVLTFAMTSSSVSGTDKGQANGKVEDLEFSGSRLVR